MARWILVAVFESEDDADKAAERAMADAYASYTREVEGDAQDEIGEIAQFLSVTIDEMNEKA